MMSCASSLTGTAEDKSPRRMGDTSELRSTSLLGLGHAAAAAADHQWTADTAGTEAAQRTMQSGEAAERRGEAAVGPPHPSSRCRLPLPLPRCITHPTQRCTANRTAHTTAPTPLHHAHTLASHTPHRSHLTPHPSLHSPSLIPYPPPLTTHSSHLTPHLSPPSPSHTASPTLRAEMAIHTATSLATLTATLLLALLVALLLPYPASADSVSCDFVISLRGGPFPAISEGITGTLVYDPSTAITPPVGHRLQHHLHDVRPAQPVPGSQWGRGGVA